MGLKRYCIEYRSDDPGSPIFTTVVRRYNMEHVLDAWNDSDSSEGFIIVKVYPMPPARSGVSMF